MPVFQLGTSESIDLLDYPNPLSSPPCPQTVVHTKYKFLCHRQLIAASMFSVITVSHAAAGFYLAASIWTRLASTTHNT